MMMVRRLLAFFQIGCFAAAAERIKKTKSKQKAYEKYQEGNKNNYEPFFYLVLKDSDIL